MLETPFYDIPSYFCPRGRPFLLPVHGRPHSAARCDPTHRGRRFANAVMLDMPRRRLNPVGRGLLQLFCDTGPCRLHV